MKKKIPMLRRALALGARSFALSLVIACGSDSTTGRPVALRTEVRAEPSIAQAFTAQTGWTVRLSKATISIAALYYFDGEPAFVTKRSRTLRERLAALSLVPVARAHPGHYLAGNAMGQMTTFASVDLFAGATQLPPGTGVTGSYRSARFAWGTPRAEPALSQLGTKVADVWGVAEKRGQTVHFRLWAELADVARSVRMGAVEGCAFEAAEVEDDGLVTLRVDPRVWFKLVDFAGVAPGSAEAPTEIAAGETAQIAFALGLAQLSAYHFSFTP